MSRPALTGSPTEEERVEDGTGPSEALSVTQPAAAPRSPFDTGLGRLRTAATTWAGRLLLAVVGFKLAVGLFGAAAPAWLRALDSAGTIVVVAALGYLLLRTIGPVHRRLLWRVRRKLALSYLLIGFVPILLLVSFFLLAGTMLVLTFSSSLVVLSFEDVQDDAVGLAAASAADLRGLDDPGEMRAVLERRLLVLVTRHPDASVAVVPQAPPGSGPAAEPVGVGPWGHTPGLPAFPGWLERSGGGLVITEGAEGRAVVARGAEQFTAGGRVYAVVVDLPIDDQVVGRMLAPSGIDLTEADVATSTAAPGEPAVPAAVPEPVVFGVAAPVSDITRFPWFSDFELVDWVTGEPVRGTVAFRVDPTAFYGQVVQGGNLSFARALLVVLTLIGVMFLTIEAVALVMGFALAKSITGAVHELFAGTERVRRGDLVHPIQVDTQDQLGELAGSFNAMTGSIAGLLKQAAEKRRLEEELRIARDIQMSLLPTGPITFPGLSVTAVCRPAREVGGDYYDFVPLGGRRLGVLVADVSGKGTSAAFYMAELKGLMLSLSSIYESPKRLLMELNRFLSESLDDRTFITMMYAVVDLEARTVTYARAGHTPLIYVPANDGAPGPVQVLIPDGMVVGLRLQGIEERFRELLEERSFGIYPGDLLVLFTDGITEAMNEELDLFGEERLSRVLEDHGHLPSDEFLERILGDIEAFVGGADQHDDMTIVLLRIDALLPAEVPPTGDHA